MIINDKSIIYNGDKIVDEWNITLNLGYDHLLVGMSGGMDSSILLWMIAYHMDKNNLDLVSILKVQHQDVNTLKVVLNCNGRLVGN